MPELPAMENFRRAIAAEALNRQIVAVTVKRDRVVREDAATLSNDLVGLSLKEATRHGKVVFVRAGSGKTAQWLSFHCGMTGYFSFPAKGEDIDKLKKAKIALHFADGGAMAFYDPRMFGRVEKIASPKSYIADHELGTDALDISGDEFAEKLSTSGKPLKTLFLDQSVMAGIGNVYGDEIPFQAKISPLRKGKDLSKAELTRLYKVMRKIMTTAIDKKAWLDHWDMLPKSWLVHSRDAGAACPRCGGEIAAYKAGGRDGFWSPDCQS